MTTSWRTQQQQQPFFAWLRNNPKLDSRNFAISATDCDLVVHQYKCILDGRRDPRLQCLMLVEIKCEDREVPFAQRDTLMVLDKIMRKADGIVANGVRGNRFRLRCFGVHYLHLSGTDPINSESIRWDSKRVSISQLESLLAFDLHPDSLTSNALRNHHLPSSIPTLPGITNLAARRDRR